MRRSNRKRQTPKKLEDCILEKFHEQQRELQLQPHSPSCNLNLVNHGSENVVQVCEVDRNLGTAANRSKTSEPPASADKSNSANSRTFSRSVRKEPEAVQAQHSQQRSVRAISKTKGQLNRETENDRSHQPLPANVGRQSRQREIRDDENRIYTEAEYQEQSAQKEINRIQTRNSNRSEYYDDILQVHENTARQSKGNSSNQSLSSRHHGTHDVSNKSTRSYRVEHNPNDCASQYSYNSMQSKNYAEILDKETELQEFEAHQRILKKKAEIQLALLEEEEALIKKRQEINELKRMQSRHQMSQDGSEISFHSRNRQESANRNESEVSFKPRSHYSQNDNRQAEVDPITKLSDAILKAIETNAKAVVPTQNESLDKFLTRQGIDKNLPVFYGCYEEWPNFIVQYTTSTNICEFSDAENLIRLQKCLRGEARETVQALLISPNNVDKIIKTLKNRFGRSECIIESLIDKVRKFPNLKEDNFEMIISFANNVQNILATVETLGSNGYLNNSSLRNELLAKLPVNLKLKWAEHIQLVEEPNLVDFSNWLQDISS